MTKPTCCIPGCLNEGNAKLLPTFANSPQWLCSQHANIAPMSQKQPVLDSHYTALTPEPIDLINQWGLTGGFVCGTIIKLVARIWSCNRPGTQITGYNKRGSLEDIAKLRFYVDQLERWLREQAKEKETPLQ